MPQRIQCKRTKGSKLPPNTVFVGSGAKWRNPYPLYYGWRWAANSFARLSKDWTPEQVQEVRDELRGKNLACHCPLEEPCHADILLEIANDKNGPP